MTRVGILALQGAVGEHADALTRLGVDTVAVKQPDHLDGIDALVLPGGESTTMSMLLSSAGLFDPIAKLLEDDLPCLGTCAGMILLADDVVDGRPDQRSFGLLDMRVRRNAWGRQVDAVFIRAPRVESIGPDVSVLARIDDEPVLCRSGSTIVSSFHPELSGDLRIHQLFLQGVE